MKKILIPLMVIVVITGACLPVAAPSDSSAPQVDTQATIDSIVNTAAAQTLAAQPSPTTAPPTLTASPTETVPPTDVTVTLATTSVPNLTTTPATATSGTEISSDITITATIGSAGEITLTPTLGVLTYGTLPPAVPSGPVTLVNKSKAQAYISLQLCDTEAKGAILEYPVQSVLNIDAPIGNYNYVVWVGGKQLLGTLKVTNDDSLKITIYKDKVVIQ